MRSVGTTSFLVFSVLGISGCFKYSATPEATQLINQAALDEQTLEASEFCERIASVEKPPPAIVSKLGECRERGWNDQEPDRTAAIGEYSRAASCGEPRAIDALKRLGEQAPMVPPFAPKEIVGARASSVSKEELDRCGVEQGISATGWILYSPVVVAGVVVAVPFIPLAMAFGVYEAATEVSPGNN